MVNLFNVNQVAFILKVHPLTIRRYIKERKLKAVKAGGNVRIREDDLEQFTHVFKPRIPQEKEAKIRSTAVKYFTNDDPLLRLAGRGASFRGEG